MDCSAFREGCPELLAHQSERGDASRAELDAHKASCAECAAYFDGLVGALTALRPSTRVSASPTFKEKVMTDIAAFDNADAGEKRVVHQSHMRIWKLGAAAAIAATVLAGVLFFAGRGHKNEPGIKPAAFTILSQAVANEESLYGGDEVVHMATRIVVKAVADPEVAGIRWLPVATIKASGKTSYDQLSLPATPGEEYTVREDSWFDPATRKSARVITAHNKLVFANSYDGEAVYLLETDAAGVQSITRTPVEQGFALPKDASSFLGITSGYARLLKQENKDLVTDQGACKLSDGSDGQALRVGMPAGGPSGMTTYWVFRLRTSDGTIGETEWMLNGKSLLFVERMSLQRGATDASWDLSAFKARLATGGGNAAKPAVHSEGLIIDASLESALKKAEYEAYLLAQPPSWTSGGKIIDAAEPDPQHRIFAVVYPATSGRTVTVVQSYTMNRMIKERPRTARLVYTSPNGCKVWSDPSYVFVGSGMLSLASAVTHASPGKDVSGYLVETPSSTAISLAVNGALSDEELRKLVDSIVAAKSAPSSVGLKHGGEPSAPAVMAGMVKQDVSVEAMVKGADFETYIPSAAPSWTDKRVITDILDVASPPHRMFSISYVAKDERHVVLVQSYTYNIGLGASAKSGTLVYTSPNGCKAWGSEKGKWLAGILLQSAGYVTGGAPAENRMGYLIETPAGTFPALAVNGPLSDEELHAIVDSLVPAKEYKGQ
jgi:hypothetical protein